ncbi:DUF5688 family protein [Otoolea muris]|uniref:DUF5688 family protein n=1 Tax=Otoolea muris TaxID=2941515 RepID=UPI00203A72B3|nr:DUF5688 family protein [Otoolea muris]
MYRVEKEILGEIKNGDSTAQGNSISQMGKIFCEAVDGILREMFDFQKVKGKLIYQLVNFDRNQEMLRELPYKEVCGDLTAVFMIVLGQGEHGRVTTKVTNRHMELWGTDIDALWQLAEENTPKLCPVKWMRLQDMLKEITEGIPDFGNLLGSCHDEVMGIPGKERRNPSDLMYVLTNTVNVRGAASILYPGVLKEMAEEMGGDFIIFPSSIHETILAKIDGFFDWEEAETIVREINRKEVAPEDILSDMVYYYSQEKDCIMLARETGGGVCSILW